MDAICERLQEAKVQLFRLQGAYVSHLSGKQRYRLGWMELEIDKQLKLVQLLRQMQQIEHPYGCSGCHRCASTIECSFFDSKGRVCNTCVEHIPAR